MTKHKAKRRIKLIQPRFQLKLAGSFAALCALALLTESLVLGLELTNLSKQLPSGGAYLAEQIGPVITRSLLISAGLILPALMVIGIRITFKVAGPLYRVERHLNQILAGEWPERFKLRDTDDLQHLCALLNDALEYAKEHGGSAEAEAAETEQRTAA